MAEEIETNDEEDLLEYKDPEFDYEPMPTDVMLANIGLAVCLLIVVLVNTIPH